MTHYKSDHVYKRLVVESAIIANATSVIINLLLSVAWIATSRIAGCGSPEQRYEVVAALVGIHVMVFIVVFILMCGTFMVISRPSPK